MSLYQGDLLFKMRKCIVFTYLLITAVLGSAAGSDNDPDEDTLQVLLLEDINIKIDATYAINDLYNFKFDRAEMQFRWLKQKYPHHPISFFLLGLSQWWKIAVNIDNEAYDESFLLQIDSAIYYAEILFEQPRWKTEAAFFLAAGHGFKGRLFSERKQWGKAAIEGKNALKYLEDCKNKPHLSPELMFGDGLYNYFSIWIHDNYPLLRPLIALFPKGDKSLGLEQLRTVATNAFYTRTEAQYWLMRILANEENDLIGAIQIAEYLHKTFPDNAYFHRYYTRLMYASGQMRKTEELSLEILSKIDSCYIGYEEISGRYAAFYLGQINERKGDFEASKEYYKRAMGFAENIDATESGYYIYAMLGMAEIYLMEGDKELAKDHLKQVRKNTKRKDPANKRARQLLKEL